MLDCSRNAVPNLKFIKEFIVALKKCGYNQLQLYMEDTYKIEGEPFFGYFRGAYSKEELQEIDEFAFAHGIELVPAIQVLGHLKNIFMWREYDQIHDTADCLLAKEEKTYELIDKMIKQVSSTFKTNKINIGMDESFSSGRGYFLDKFGYEKADDIFIYHLGRVSKILEKYNGHGLMWGDMFYRNMNHGQYYTKTPIVSESTKKLLPSNISIIYWDYYSLDAETISAMAESAKGLCDDAYFAGGVWSWVGFMPRCDFAIKQTKVAIENVKKAGISQFINTEWGDNGAECSKLAVLPSLYYFAQCINNKNDEEIKECFKETFDMDFDTFISLKNINDLDNVDTDVHNVCKYMLYNDLMMGIYDNTVNTNKAKCFTEAKKIYEKQLHHPTFGYIFKTAYELANVLEIKYDLGLEIRKAYFSKDKSYLNVVIDKITDLKNRLHNFYEAFKNQWYIENKLNGFEIQTQRIGGLILRCDEVKELLVSYRDNKIDKIDVLEENVLPFKDVKEGTACCINSYEGPSSVNSH